MSESGHHVGDVASVLVDPQNDYATHSVIDKGVLQKTCKLEPVAWIKAVEDDVAHLVVDTEQLKHLP